MSRDQNLKTLILQCLIVYHESLKMDRLLSLAIKTASIVDIRCGT